MSTEDGLESDSQTVEYPRRQLAARPVLSLDQVPKSLVNAVTVPGLFVGGLYLGWYYFIRFAVTSVSDSLAAQQASQFTLIIETLTLQLAMSSVAFMLASSRAIAISTAEPRGLGRLVSLGARPTAALGSSLAMFVMYAAISIPATILGSMLIGYIGPFPNWQLVQAYLPLLASYLVLPRFCLAAQISAHEGLSVGPALRASSERTRGLRWRFGPLLFLANVLIFVGFNFMYVPMIFFVEVFQQSLAYLYRQTRPSG